MPTFKLNYKNGSHEVVQTDAADVADQVNRTFGLTVEEAEAFGVSVEMLPDDPEDLLQALTSEVVEHPDETLIVPKADEQAPEQQDAAQGTSEEPGHIHVHVGEESQAGDSSN